MTKSLMGLQPAVFGAVASASQLVRRIAAVLVIEGLEVLSPPQGSGDGELGEGRT
ncbi:MAG: hypothetical protein LC775_11420 [Acidobacteria bacterium]|nr:hypothetical protein [Acidobacteriota bacterium]